MRRSPQDAPELLSHFPGSLRSLGSGSHSELLQSRAQVMEENALPHERCQPTVPLTCAVECLWSSLVFAPEETTNAQFQITSSTAELTKPTQLRHGKFQPSKPYKIVLFLDVAFHITRNLATLSDVMLPCGLAEPRNFNVSGHLLSFSKAS